MTSHAARNGNSERALGEPEQVERPPIGLSAREAALALGVNERTIRRAIARGELAAVKQGRSFQITLEALDRYRTRPSVRAGRGTIAVVPREGGLARPVLVSLPGRAPPRLASLPTPLTRFIGREREVAAVAGLIRQDGVRLVTLIGPGGVGKTRVALRVTEEVMGDFADGVAFISLAPVRDAELVLTTITHALGLREDEERGALLRLSTYFEDRSFLLMLDNFEQVMNAAPKLTDLLLVCPRLTLLVTSRSPLRLAGERLFTVPPLALPDRSASGYAGAREPPLDELATIEAIQLFIDRAQSVSADFALTVDNADAVGAICRRTDGLPLAIELAAARTRALTPTDLLAQMTHQLSVLANGPRDQPPRLRTMANAVAWSYDLLAPAEQALFRAVAVFSGGFILEAASQVVATLSLPSSAVFDLLIALVDKSLVHSAAGAGGKTRYGLLEPVREYGLERLAGDGEEIVVRNAHANWCIDFAELAEPELSGPQQSHWFAVLDAELPNMRAALTWLLERQDISRGVRLATALSWFWSSRGHLYEALEWFEAFLSLPVVIPPRVRALCIREAANIAQWQGDDERAAAYAAEALALFREHGAPLQIAYGLRGSGSIAIDRGALDQAASFLAESWEMLRAIGTPWDRAFAIFLQGRLAAAGDRFAEAVERFTEAAAAFHDVGDRAYVAAALGRLGAAAIRFGDEAGARRAYAESLLLAQQLNDQSWVAWGLAGATHLAHSSGKPVAAGRFLGAAMAIRENIGEHRQHVDDLAPEVRKALMAPGFAAAREQGSTLPVAQVIAEALAVLTGNESASQTSRRRLLGPDVLTAREREVLRFLVEGLSDKEIAVALGISRNTASNHVRAIREKLGVPSRAAAAALAVRNELVS